MLSQLTSIFLVLVLLWILERLQSEDKLKVEKPDVMSYLLSKLLTSIELLGTKTKTKERPNTKTKLGIEHKPPFIINQTLFYTFNSLPS